MNRDEAWKLLESNGWWLSGAYILFAPSRSMADAKTDPDDDKYGDNGKYICQPNDSEALSAIWPNGCWQEGIRCGLNWSGGPW